MALDLIRDAEGDVVGVTALEMETGEVMMLEAKTTIFATGGAGRIFAASTNAFINTGDGMGMAARAGLPLQDMEFWQFHPTGVAGAGVLITEGVRGEGGILINRRRALHGALCADAEGPGAARLRVALDGPGNQGRPRLRSEQGPRAAGPAPHRRRHHQKRLPSILEIGHKFANVDATKEPIPVVPTIHYQMGGIPTNIHGQVVTPNGDGTQKVVNGLYAIGECACVSVHGANRLGTNSLLDLVVFGRAAGNHIVAANLKQKENKPLPKDAADFALNRLNKLETSTGGEKVQGGQRHPRHHAEVLRRVPYRRDAEQRRRRNHEAGRAPQARLVQGQVEGVQHRPRGSAGTGQPDRNRQATILGRSPQGIARRPRPRRLPAPRRRQLDEAHAVVLEGNRTTSRS
jgi:succinate dehydrogenase / fumarate reductase flavoprotein subunit